MSVFSSHLSEVRNHLDEFKKNPNTSYLDSMDKVIVEHMKKLDLEFGVETKEFQELKQYKEVLHSISMLIVNARKAGTGSNELEGIGDQIEEKIKEAHNLIYDVESLIRKEFGVAHKFLE